MDPESIRSDSAQKGEEMGTVSVYLAILAGAVTIYAVRTVPFLMIRKPIQSRFIRSFLYYLPYVTLSVMTFPAILTVSDSIWPGVIALAAGVIAAWLSENLFVVAIACGAAVFLAEAFLPAV